MDKQPTSADSKFSLAASLIRLIASLAVPLVLVGALLWWLVSQDHLDRTVQAQANNASAAFALTTDGLVANGSDGLVVADAAALDARVSSVLGPLVGTPLELRIVGFDGVAKYSTSPNEVGEITGLSGIAADAVRGSASGQRGTATGDLQPMVYSLPVVVDDAVVGAARLSVADDPAVTSATANASSMGYLFGGALLAMLIALVPMAWWSLGEVRRQFRKTRVLAMNDNLTGLANRTQFRQRLDEALAAAQRSDDRVGLIMVDLDGFKAINDTGGHAAGDRLLRRVAAALGEVTRRNEIPCRLGGDEFAVVAPRIGSREELASLAERLHQSLDLNVDFADGRQLRVTASMGLALYPEDAATADDLLNVADVGMYAVKASRKAKLPRSIRSATTR